MRARLPDTIKRLRPAGGRRGDQPVERPERPDRVDCVPVRDDRAPARPEARVRQAGGPEDLAHYTCGCGLAFTASVSTSVTCPHCGGDQDW